VAVNGAVGLVTLEMVKAEPPVLVKTTVLVRLS
jgi:hypothetical protein